MHMRFITKKQLAKFKEKLKKHKKLLVGAGIGITATVGTIGAVHAYRKTRKIGENVQHVESAIKTIQNVKKGVINTGKAIDKKHHEVSVFTVENVKKGVAAKQAKEKRKGSLILPGAFPS